MGRTIGFNKPVVQKLKRSLKNIIYLETDQIYNVERTVLTTVQQIGKVVVKRWQEQIGYIVSSESETLVIICGCINAIGHSFFLIVIVPRKHFKDFMTENTSPGTIRFTSSSCWMT